MPFDHTVNGKTIHASIAITSIAINKMIIRALRSGRMLCLTYSSQRVTSPPCNVHATINAAIQQNKTKISLQTASLTATITLQLNQNEQMMFQGSIALKINIKMDDTKIQRYDDCQRSAVKVFIFYALC